jgi:hypothetical protein
VDACLRGKCFGRSSLRRTLVQKARPAPDADASEEICGQTTPSFSAGFVLSRGINGLGPKSRSRKIPRRIIGLSATLFYRCISQRYRRAAGRFPVDLARLWFGMSSGLSSGQIVRPVRLQAVWAAFCAGFWIVSAPRANHFCDADSLSPIESIPRIRRVNGINYFPKRTAINRLSRSCGSGPESLPPGFA